MKLKIDEKNCLFKDLKIPKGYRLIEDYEVLKELRTNKELKQSLVVSWCWYNTELGVRAVRFVYDGRGFFVSCDVNPNGSGRSRGVFVKKGDQK